MRIRVKVCGITRIEDALVAAEAGVDAIGLVFYPNSARAVEAEQAAHIARALPPLVTCVGLFVNATPETIAAVLDVVPLQLLQFHGDECPSDCGRFGLPYLKAVSMRAGLDLARYADTYPDASGFLLDSHGGGKAGGTGERFDWALTPRSFARPWLLAGGLNADNVADAIQRTRPWGIDLSSGVESAPGVKSAEKIKALMNEVRRVNCS
ncbi:MAG: phosphoribosylanthranilate isomerase [Thiotrichales bacterium]